MTQAGYNCEEYSNLRDIMADDTLNKPHTVQNKPKKSFDTTKTGPSPNCQSPLSEHTLQMLWQQSLGGTPLDSLDPEMTCRFPLSDTSLPEHPKEPYEIIEELGKGGMGIVYKARQHRLQRDVAIKKIRPEQANLESKKSFLSEAYVTAALDHPNIVPIYDMWQEQGEISLSMKVIGGECWRDKLGRRAEQEYGQVEDIQTLISVCNAIAYAHSKNIIHCDLKPENVMLGDFGEVLVLDWGVALDIENKDQRRIGLRSRADVTGPFGTPSFMSPELAEGRAEDIGKHTDIYLLGSTLYKILTGQSLHSGKSVLHVLFSASESKRPIFQESVPGELADICCKAVHREADKRHKSVSAFKEELITYLSHRESSVIGSKALQKHRSCQETMASSISLSEQQRTQLYRDFAEAAAGYKQALELWRGNKLAEHKSQEILHDYAHAALKNDDLGLAETQISQLPDADPEKKVLSKELATIQWVKLKAQRRSKWTSYGLVSAILVIIVGLGVFVYTLNAALERSENLQLQTNAARKQADLKAIEARVQASLAAEQTAKAEKKAQEALENLAKFYELSGDRALNKLQIATARQFYALSIQRADSHQLRLKYATARALGSQRLFDAGQTLDYDKYIEATFKRHTDSSLTADERASLDKTISTHQASSNQIGSLSPCGRYLAYVAPKIHSVKVDNHTYKSALPGRVVVLYDLTNKSRMFTLNCNSNFQDLCWNPAKQQLITAGLPYIKIWSLESKQCQSTLTFGSLSFKELSCSPSGRYLAVHEKRGVNIWDLEKNKVKDSIEGDFANSQLFWNNDQAMVMSHDRGLVTIRKISTLEPSNQFSIGGSCLLFSPSLDGQFIAAVRPDSTVDIWSCKTNDKVRTFKGINQEILSVAWDPSGLKLAVLAGSGLVRIYSRQSSKAIHIVEVDKMVSNNAAIALRESAPFANLLANGSYLITKFQGRIKVWNVENLRAWKVIPGDADELKSVSFSENGNKLLYQRQSQLLQCDLSKRTTTSYKTSKQHTVYNTNPDQTMAISNGPRPQVLNLAQQTSFALNDTNGIIAAAWPKQGSFVGLFTDKSDITIWDLEKRIRIKRFTAKSKIKLPVWSPNGRLCALYNSSTIKILKMKTKQYIQEYKRKLFARPVWIDNENIALGQSSKIIIRNIFNPKKNREYQCKNDIQNLSVSPSRRFLLVQYKDLSLLLWDLSKDVSYQIPDCHRLFFRANDQRAVGLSKSGSIRRFDLTRFDSKGQARQRAPATKGIDVVTNSVFLSEDAHFIVFAGFVNKKTTVPGEILRASHFSILDLENDKTVVDISGTTFFVSPKVHTIAYLSQQGLVVTHLKEFLTVFRKSKAEILRDAQESLKFAIRIKDPLTLLKK
jgi:serine/threonine protein kinase/WD40 repeat protein